MLKYVSVLLFVSLATASAPNWRYYPVNTVEAGVVTSGLLFSVEPRGTFTVTAVTQEGDAQPITTTRALDMDPGAGGGFLRFPIDNLDRFRVLRITVTVAGRAATYEHPGSGRLYEVGR